MEMENHPIPQDITGFQFKLVGNMTLKQFAYLAFGIVVAFITSSLPVIIFIKAPIMAISAGLGTALAFLPIDGRPLDIMIRNFFIAIFRPTKYIYATQESVFTESGTKRESIAQMSEKQLADFLSKLPEKANKLDKSEMVFFQAVDQMSYAKAAAQPNFVPQHAFANKTPPLDQQTMPPPQLTQTEAAAETIGADEDLKKTAALLENELLAAKARESAQPQINSDEYLQAHQRVLELQKKLSDILLQNQQLETRVTQLQKTVSEQGKQVYSPSSALPQQPRETKFVRSLPQNMQKSAGLPIASEFPNIISGIVKDARGNPLPNILVEVKDGQDNAVRAFKTNALGQFASATPLVNGAYTIDFEDAAGQHRFDMIGFSAEGKVILPIEVISVDAREDIRRSLFN